MLCVATAGAQPSIDSLDVAPDTLAVRRFAGAPMPEPLPERRAFAASAAVGGRIYLFGGYNGGRVSATVSLDPATGRWARHAAVPDGLLPGVALGGSAAVFHGKVFMGSASESSWHSLVYDPGADAWSTGPDFSRTRGAAAFFSDGANLMVFGGVDDHNGVVPTFESLTGGKWENAGPFPFEAARPSPVVLGGKLYLFGGHGARNPGRVDEARSYDPSTGRWSALAPLPTARCGAAVAAVDGMIYAAGGDAQNNGPALSVVEVYDPAKDSWSQAPPMPRPRAFAAAAAYRGKLYVFGGLTPELRGTATVQVYDPRSRAWSFVDSAPSAPEPRPAFEPRYVEARPSIAPRARFERKAPERPQDYALVIGVGSYKRLPPADFAETDARDMSSALEALGVPEENIVTLTGSKASMSDIAKYVDEWLPRRVSPESRVYFYYSGHGAPDVKDGSAYLMPWDADAAFVKSTGISLSRLYGSLGELKAGHVIAMIDACFSGAGGRSVVEKGIRPLVTVRLPQRTPPRITVISASESEEVAGSLPERGHGLFSFYALQGLAGAADAQGKGHVTINDLYFYVRKNVILDARRQNREQTPTLTTSSPKLRLY